MAKFWRVMELASIALVGLWALDALRTGANHDVAIARNGVMAVYALLSSERAKRTDCR